MKDALGTRKYLGTTSLLGTRFFVYYSKYKMAHSLYCLTLLLAFFLGLTSAQSTASCSATLTAGYATPSVASGYVAKLVANNLTAPRGIKFDSQGHLLVVEQDVGITALTFSTSSQDCMSVAQRKLLIDNTALNHGIEISSNGTMLYASNPEAVFAWNYNPSTQAVTGSNQTLVENMTTSDHTTRTLLLPKHAPGLLVVTRGSTSNIDAEAADITTGHSQVKAFNLANMTRPYDFDTDGLLLGWGLRNDVGIDEEPIYGGIYSVENSADDVQRQGQDIHQNSRCRD
jgi:glucose/arabinose dehydrogenase